MKSKKCIFSILRSIERTKIKKELITLKNIHKKRREYVQQLTLLCNYQQEYIKQLGTKTILGICIQEWKNYNNFISILQNIIQTHQSELNKTEKIIQEKLKIWSYHYNKIKLWNSLSTKYNKKILKIKTIKTENLNNYYIQLKFIKKGDDVNV